MSFNGRDFHGGVHQCYPVFSNMISCYKNNFDFAKTCFYETEDFQECMNRDKERLFNHKLVAEIHKQKLVSVPEYDIINDKYIHRFDVQKNADYIFKDN